MPQTPVKLSELFKGQKEPEQRTSPLWAGPEGKGAQGGVTFSILRKWLECRERARCYLVEGIKANDRFDHKIYYGNIWHACEEALAAKRDWKEDAYNYARKTQAQYRFDQEEVLHWYQVCLVQFPEYIKYWATHPDVLQRKPLYQEKVFDVPYKLPSGRVVRLRGKYDAGDLIKGEDNKWREWIQENKTKGRVSEEKLTRQLTNDLQSMIYVISRSESSPVAGVRYNVVRREVTIKKHVSRVLKSGFKQGESDEHYYERVATYYKENPSHYFMRWKTPITPLDIENFKRRTLDPLLQQVCQWYDMVSVAKTRNCSPFDLHANNLHFQMPFGVAGTNVDEYGTDLDNYLISGSMTGLTRIDNLFPEL